ncbi:MAG: RNA-binding cell elongation regulator Jag/EloR [Clostridia bacterium]
MGNITIEKAAKTVEQAISLALEELNVTEDQVEIEVIEQGGKTLLGMGRNKDAIVRVTLYDYSSDIVRDFLGDILEKMQIEAKINIEEDEESIRVDIESKSSGLLIGRRGETIDAIQYLVSLVVNRNSSRYKKIIVDTEGYRLKREEILQSLAKRLAAKVERSGRSAFLEPMNPYERRIIHSALQDNQNVQTYSIGEEPNRKVVIKTAN